MLEKKWKFVPIEALYLGLYDGPHATPPPASEGPVFLGIKNITEDGKLDMSEIRLIAEEDFQNWTKRVLPRPGDIVFTYEATLNRYAIIPKGFRGCLGRRLALIRPNPERVDSRYLFYYFFGDEWRRTIANNMILGSTVDRIPLISFPKFKVQVPPLPIQRTIASILSVYDDLIENNTRRIAILEKIAQMLYQEWFVNFRFPGYEQVKMVESELGMIPERWEVSKLGIISSITMGQSPSSQFYNEKKEGLPFHQGVTDFGDYFPRDRVYCTAENRIAEAGDILFSIRAPVGRINIANKRIIIGRGLAAIRSNTDNQTFILWQLKELFQKEDIIGNGAIFKAVTKEDVHNINMLKPPPSIIAEFERTVHPILLMIKVMTDRNAVLRYTRYLLLPKIISGEIDVSSWAEGDVEAARELAGSVASMTNRYDPIDSEVRRVAEVGPVAPIDEDALEWESLWE